MAIASVDLSRLEPSPEETKEKPRKYIGYKGYSEFIASETDYYVLRSFEHTRGSVSPERIGCAGRGAHQPE